MKNKMKKAISLILALAMSASLLAVSAFALAETDFELTGGSVTVDGTEDKTVNVVFSAKSAMTVIGVQGTFSDTSDYLAMTDYEFPVELTGQNGCNPATGALVYADDINFVGYSVAENGNVATAVYTVDKETPAGEYTVQFALTAAMDGSFGTLSGKTYTATITVERASTDVASTGAALNKSTATLTVGNTETLTASLLPNNTTETISSVAWTSSDEAVATVADGTVTAVAAGEATITATVTTSGDKTWTATCAVTVNAAPVTSEYTVSIVRNGEGKVYAGDTVTMDVKVQGTTPFNGAYVTVTYDKTLFTCTTEDVTPSDGKIVIDLQDKNAVACTEAATIKTLTFEALDAEGTKTGDFGFRDAVVNEFAGAAAPENALPAKTVGTSVTVTEQYTVKFLDKEGDEIDTYTVDDNEKVTTVPDAPVVDYYDFAKWQNVDSDSDEVYTADEIKMLTVTADVTYKAVYAPQSYAVTLPNGVTGSNKATYNTDYTATINGFDAANYGYTVKYTVGGVTKELTALTANVTIPGADIKGAMSVELIRTIKNIALKVKDEYVTGYTLITVEYTGTGPAPNYAYDGNTMYYVEAYGAYAWLVAEGAAADLVTTTDAEKVTIASIGNDVNNSGLVDANDATCVFGCYKVVDEYPVDDYMAMYLRADVTGDYKVDTSDVNALLTAIHP